MHVKMFITMRALSVRQPFAELIMQGVKTEEYRSQPTNITGQVYIYASLTPSENNSYDLAVDELPRGVIVGTVEITGCKKNRGGYAWKLSKPKRLKKLLKPLKKPQPVWFNPF